MTDNVVILGQGNVWRIQSFAYRNVLTAWRSGGSSLSREKLRKSSLVRLVSEAGKLASRELSMITLLITSSCRADPPAIASEGGDIRSPSCIASLVNFPQLQQKPIFTSAYLSPPIKKPIHSVCVEALLHVEDSIKESVY